MYFFVGFRNSTPPKNYQLIVHYCSLKYSVDDFVGELTFQNKSINTLCQIKAGAHGAARRELCGPLLERNAQAWNHTIDFTSTIDFTHTIDFTKTIYFTGTSAFTATIDCTSTIDFTGTIDFRTINFTDTIDFRRRHTARRGRSWSGCAARCRSWLRKARRRQVTSLPARSVFGL